MEYGWQNIDAGGRQDMREAIATAEARLFEFLGYRVGPQWVTKELQYPWPQDAGLQYAYSQDVKGRWLSMDVQEGYIQELGPKATTLIGDGSNVTYSDQYGDGVTDTATITVDLTGLDPQPTAAEIAVYFTPDDRLDGDDIDNYEIRPIKASISGTTLTIKARSWLFVVPVKRQGVNVPNIDPDATGAGAGNFAQKVDVYRIYTETAGTTTDDSHAILIWESDPPAWYCNTTGTNLTYSGNRHDPYSTARALARTNIRDRRLGYLGPVWSVYNSDNAEFTAVTWQSKQPDRVIIRYKAGANRDEINAQLPGGQWDQIVARLAMSELTRRICACDKANRELWRWQTDLSQTGGNNDVSFQAVSPDQLNNPLGTTRGAVYAYNNVKNLQLYKAAIV